MGTFCTASGKMNESIPKICEVWDLARGNFTDPSTILEPVSRRKNGQNFSPLWKQSHFCPPPLHIFLMTFSPLLLFFLHPPLFPPLPSRPQPRRPSLSVSEKPPLGAKFTCLQIYLTKSKKKLKAAQQVQKFCGFPNMANPILFSPTGRIFKREERECSHCRPPLPPPP